MTLEESRMLIDGKLVPASGGRTYENVNPATEQVIGVTADATADDMRDAIGAARRAFDETSWSTDRELRARGIRQLAAALAEDREVLRQVIVAEVGCPVMLTEVVQVDRPIDDLPYWADMAVSYDYDTDLPEMEFWGGRHRRQIWREPVGVVAAITPWNYPLFLHLAKLGPALASGCTVVLKPPPDTPWSATHIGRLIAERTDIPPGVVNIVTAADPAAGEVLTTDPRVDMITFTGSAATGRRIMAAAAPTLKKIALELGGKSALIALDDADIATTALFAGLGMCTHAGQGCAMTSRLLVPRSRYEEAVEAAVGGMASVKVGDPTDPEVLQGPQISSIQRDRVLGYIEKGKAEGAHRLRRRTSGRPAGRVLRRADRDRRVRRELHGRARGDLRTGTRRAALRRRRRRRSYRQQLDLRPIRRGPERITRTRYGGRSSVAHRHCGDQRRPVVRRRHPVRGLQAERSRSRERRAGLRGVPRDEVGRFPGLVDAIRVAHRPLLRRE